MIWDREYECMPRQALEATQLERLRAQLARVYQNVPFYRRAFDEQRVAPDDIRSLDDLGKLPFTVKTDFRDNYPYGLAGRAHVGDRAHPRLQRHHRQAHRRRLHRGRHRACGPR